MQCALPPDPVPSLIRSLVSLLNLSSASSSTVPYSPHLNKEHTLRLSVSLLLHLFRLFVKAYIEPHRAPSKIFAQSVAAECMLVGWLSYEWCVTNGATATAPNTVPQQITGGWPRTATLHALPRSHLQRPPEWQSLRIWSEPVRLSHLVQPSPSSSSRSDLTPLTKLNSSFKVFTDYDIVRRERPLLFLDSVFFLGGGKAWPTDHWWDDVKWKERVGEWWSGPSGAARGEGLRGGEG